MTLNVCVITHSAYPGEPRARRMAEALASQGYAVDVLCLRYAGQPAAEVVDGVQVNRLPVTHHQGAGARVYLMEYARFFLLASLQLLRRQPRRRYALIQVHNPPDPLIFCTLLLKLRGIPVILDLHEMAPELFMSRFRLAPESAAARLLLFFERLACRYADAVMACHEPHRRLIISRGTPAPKITAVLNSPDERIFDASRYRVRSGWEPDGPFVLIYHGGILERQGVDLLVRAAARLRAQIPGLQLELYGAGDFLPAVMQLITDLGLADIVHVHGYRPQEEMPGAIVAAQLGVVPMQRDIFMEYVLPTKLMDYVALGLPAVTARMRTSEEYFDDTMVAFFTPGDLDDLCDKILLLYRTPAAAQAQAERATRFTELHNWQVQKTAYLAAVSRLLASRGVKS